MSNLAVFEQNGVLVVDSRLVASELNVTHSDWMRNIIKKYQAQIEQGFGSLRFENEVKKREIGATSENFVWLTEDQVLFVMTLSRNTERVIQCKMNLVKAFSNARKQLQQPQPMTTIQALAVMVNQMAEQERRMIEQEQQLKLAESRLAAVECEQGRYIAPSGNKYTVLGFAVKQGLEVSAKVASQKGRQASLLCRKREIDIERIYDPRFGYVGLYPESVLIEVFK
jgi:phage regulator Rha-like protein